MKGLFPDEQRIRLTQQRYKLTGWIRSRLWAQVIAAMVLGLAFGAMLGPDTPWLSGQTAERLGAWLALPGRLFLALIGIVLVPLIFSSIVGGLTGARSSAELRSIGGRFAGFVLVTTFAAVWIGVLLASWLKPGAEIAQPAPSPTPAQSGDFDLSRAPDIIVGVLPTNPTLAIAQGDLLAVVILALLVGAAATQVRRDKLVHLLGLLDALLSISMTIVRWAMYLAPVAVFGLMAQLVMREGLGTLHALTTYVGAVLLGLALLFAVYVGVLAVFVRVGPVRFIHCAGESLLLAFSTSSSSAVMPSSIASARNLGVPENVANLVIPLGATMNMAGTALYQSVAILFLAQLAGADLALGQIALITVTLVASSIGAPGTPGVSIGILLSVAAGFGIPAEGMVLVLGVDRLLDMSRTAVNVAGDITAAAILSPPPEPPRGGPSDVPVSGGMVERRQTV